MIRRMIHVNVDELHHVLWTLEFTRNGMDLVSAETVHEKLANVGYQIDLEKVKHIRAALELIKKSPYMAEEKFPTNIYGMNFAKIIKKSAERIKKNEKAPKTTYAALAALRESTVTSPRPPAQPLRDWRGDLFRFLQDPFQEREEVVPLLQALNARRRKSEGIGDERHARAIRELDALFTAQPNLRKQLKRAFAYRGKYIHAQSALTGYRSTTDRIGKGINPEKKISIRRETGLEALRKYRRFEERQMRKFKAAYRRRNPLRKR